jgi:hypothetical protein
MDDLYPTKYSVAVPTHWSGVHLEVYEGHEFLSPMHSDRCLSHHTEIPQSFCILLIDSTLDFELGLHSNQQLFPT